MALVPLRLEPRPNLSLRRASVLGELVLICMTVMLDLSLASGPQGLTTADLRHSPAAFGMNEGLAQIRTLLDRFGLCVEVAGLPNLPDRMAVVTRRLCRMWLQCRGIISDPV